jgi:RNA polymerase sigma factor (sigma-70 family)
MPLSSEVEFKKFFLINYPGLKTFLFAKCNNIDIAEDISQEAFIRLWNNHLKVEKGHAKSYLYKIGTNLLLDHLRHQKIKNKYASAPFHVDKDITDPQFIIEMEEFKVKLEQTIATMPEKSREVFLLSRIEKMSYLEMSSLLGITVKAIEKRMQKALEIMASLKLSTKEDN